MYTRDQLEKTWDQFEEAHKLTFHKMRSSCNPARDTQGHLSNAVTFIGVGVMEDSLPKMKDVFFGLLDAPLVAAKAKNDKSLIALNRLGIKQ